MIGEALIKNQDGEKTREENFHTGLMVQYRLRD